MKIVLVLGHPNERSYNHEIAGLLQGILEKDGHEVSFHDLYREDFDPRMPAEELRRRSSFDDLPAFYAAELRAADGLVVVHPDWWGLPPAIMKGWVDRVFLPGLAYAYEEGRLVPLLGRLKAAALVTRSGEEPGLCHGFWIDRVFGFCGIAKTKFIDLGPLQGREGSELQAEKEKAVKVVCAFFTADIPADGR